MAECECAYTPLGNSLPDTSTHDAGHAEQQSKRFELQRQRVRDLVLLLLVISTTSLAIVHLSAGNNKYRTSNLRSGPGQEIVLSQFAGFLPQDLRQVQYQWWTRYSKGPNDSSIDSAWDAITPAHGLVALNHTEAATMGLPASVNLPSDSSKGVYITNAYHQLHCLTVIRKTFRQIQLGEDLQYPAEHSFHCFDALRQYVMCTAEDTPLYTWGHNTTGDGQTIQCRDWTKLRSWATENTACYEDSLEPIRAVDHFGHCDDGSDGLDVEGF